MQKLIDKKASAPLIGVTPAAPENRHAQDKGQHFVQTYGRPDSVPGDLQKLIDSKTAAPLIGITPATLENWRVRGQGPPFHKTPGRTGKVLYDLADIAEWRQQRRFASTAEAAAADA